MPEGDKVQPPDEGGEVSPEGNTITCNRRMQGGGTCGTTFPLVRENLRITKRKPGTPSLISAVCPSCGFPRFLNREKSLELFASEFPEVSDPDSIGDTGSEGGSTGGGGEGGEAVGRIAPEGPPKSPSESLARTVEEILTNLQYDTKAWIPRVRIIHKMVKNTAIYQTPEGLAQLLALFGIDAQHIPLVVQYVFSRRSAPQAGIGPIYLGGEGGYGYQYSQIPLGGTSANYPPGAPQIVQTPSGQLIIMPPSTPSHPVLREERSDTVTVEEILDDEGKVKKRIVRSPKGAVPAQASNPLNDIEGILSVLQKLTAITARDDKEGDTTVILEELKAQRHETNTFLASLADRRREKEPAKSEREAALESQNVTLSSRIEEMIKEQQAQERMSIEARVKALEEGKVGTVIDTKGMTPTQAEAIRQDKNMKTVLEAVERIGDKIAEPIKDLYDRNVAYTTLLTIREMARQDNVPVETYLQAMVRPKEPTSAEVASTVKGWKDKAGRAGAKAGTGGGT